MNESYLDILEDSLRKKFQVLREIEQECLTQREILKDTQKFDNDAFDEAVSRKAELIRQVEELNTGFADIYDRVKIELEQRKSAYALKIRKMQELIREITDLGNSIEALERRNKRLAQTWFDSQRMNLNQNRKTNQAALDYYLNMNNSRITPPQFYDKKH